MRPDATASRSVRSILLTIGAALAVIAVLTAGSARAASPAPAWEASSVPLPTYFVPGGKGVYEVRAFNAGAAGTDGSPIVITDTLPAGLVVKGVHLPLRDTSDFDYGETACQTTTSGASQVVECTISEDLATVRPQAVEPASIEPSEAIVLEIDVAVPEDASGPLVNSASVVGGGAVSDSESATNQASTQSPGAGLARLTTSLLGPDGRPVDQAAAHPFEFITSYAVNVEATQGSLLPSEPVGGDVRDVRVDLPPGLIGNPTAITACTAADFTTVIREDKGSSGNYLASSCPYGSAVGLIEIQQANGFGGGRLTLPVFNLVPPPGMPAQLGFALIGAPVYIDTSVRSGSDYGITASLTNLTDLDHVSAARLVLWGTPASPVHDPLRAKCLAESANGGNRLSFGSCAAGIAPRPFLRLPTRCGSPFDIGFHFDTYGTAGTFVGGGTTSAALSDCGAVGFAPTIASAPTSTVADSPTGLHFDLHLPQSEDPEGLAVADLREALVQFPEGVAVNASSATGLAGCSPGQIGMTSAPGATPSFTPAPAACPDGSRIGSFKVSTPLLDHRLEGAVYVASQGANPFGSLIAVYLAAYDPQTGVVLKLPGRVELDPRSGRIGVRFTENPQLPFEDLEVDLDAGPRASLQTPPRCGAYATVAELTPWTAPESRPVSPAAPFPVASGPTGGCPDGGFDPRLEAGTLDPRAGSYSPFVLNLSRQDGTERLRSIATSLPRGLLARLKGVAYCSDAALAGIGEAEGTAAAQVARPDCPSASLVGSATVAAGAGPQPFFLQTGRVYLAGPYRGAPLSLAIVTPALAGPFDLGTVVVRAAIQVDPESTRITAVSDPLPTILHGLPLDLREVRVKLDRAEFVLNPTSCRQGEIETSIASVGGTVAHPSSPFRAVDCDSLPFRPRLSLSVLGGTSRNSKPRLRAVLTARQGDANIARAQVNLPHSEFLEQGHIKTVCTRTQFAAGAGNGAQCPAGSVYGRARAITPLLDQPLEGPVFLRSSSHTLPDLVAALNGQIDVVLAGVVDTGPNKGIRNTFQMVPDAPVSKFVLELRGGRRGIIVNSENLCAKTTKTHAIVRLTSQSGKVEALKPKVRNRCGAKGKRRK